jgi:hypothetical protein
MKKKRGRNSKIYQKSGNAQFVGVPKSMFEPED